MSKKLRLYVSGLYSGTNPQPGVGIARSLRQGYPEAEIIGVEYSNRCSGIHWSDFDDIWLQRPWAELDLELHAQSIGEILDSGAFWISSIDLEIMWLAELYPDGHPGLLTPPMSALAGAAKPAVTGAAGLPLKIPPFVTTKLDDWQLHEFCRDHDWKVWLKGPYYEAVRTPSWGTLEHYRHVLTKAWATDTLFLQSHVSGYEESIMFSAYRGKLLDSVYMRKRDLTELSKTWAGDCRPVDEDLLAPLRKTVRDLNWTGGAELEMVLDANGTRWLLEINPRFPAWVHGSTITGTNLPAVLVEAASGVERQPAVSQSDEFTRVVVEIPVNSEYPLSPLPEPYGGTIGHSLKHPSGLLEFANRLKDDEEAARPPLPVEEAPVDVPQSYLTDIETIDVRSLQTPAPIFFPTTAAEYFASAARNADEASTSGLRVTNAYSCKTNPDHRLLKAARDAGFLAETISMLEVQKAVAAGFEPQNIVLNGPAKWWRREVMPEGRFFAIFCDSVNEWLRVCSEIEDGRVDTEFLGIRLRTPSAASRFGVPIDSAELFEDVVTAVDKLPRHVKFGIHFHMASSSIGTGQWRHLFESMLRWCSSIESLAGRMVELLDIGGGWFPDDMNRPQTRDLHRAAELVPTYLPNVSRMLTEPGKALAQPSMALAMQILEVRKYQSDGPREVVVDGSIAELPMSFFYPHRILYQSADGGSRKWLPLGRGDSVLLGRLCMEHDIVAANVGLPDDAAEGDLLVFCDAGAYDRSMSYVFGQG